LHLIPQRFRKSRDPGEHPWLSPNVTWPRVRRRTSRSFQQRVFVIRDMQVGDGSEACILAECQDYPTAKELAHDGDRVLAQRDMLDDYELRPLLYVWDEGEDRKRRAEGPRVQPTAIPDQ
jgi:hypothetical protein